MARGRYVQNAQARLSRAQGRQQGGAGGAPGRGRGRGLGGPAPMPWDSQAQREAAELGNEAGDARASLGAEFNRTQQELGFGAGADSPYSQAAMLKEQRDIGQRTIMNTAGNQLYAGSTGNQQSANREQYDVGQKQLEDSFAAAQSDFTRQMGSTQRDEQLGLGGIKEGAIGRALASEPAPLAVGGRGAVGRGRGRIGEGQNIRRPRQAQILNARARALNARINSGGRGR